MSEDYHIGLSREQVEELLLGGEVGKRPYDVNESYDSGDIRYNDTIRVYVKMLTEEGQKKEPDGAFGW